MGSKRAAHIKNHNDTGPSMDPISLPMVLATRKQSKGMKTE